MTATTTRMLVLGESLIDRVSADGSISEHVGGSPANVALGLGRLGYPVTLLTRFGSDRSGDLIQAHLQDEVEIVQGGMPDTPTSTARVTLDTEGVPDYVFDLNWQVTFDHLSSPDVVHTGSLGAYLEPGHHEVARIVREHAGRATVTFDPNLRPLIMDRETAAARLHEFAALADVIKVSEEDLAWLHPEHPADYPVAQWLESGVKLVVLTRGERGAEAWTLGAHASVPPGSVPVVDTVGAGDAFMAGLIDALHFLDVLGPDSAAELTDLDEHNLRDVLAHANTAAGCAVAHAGAHPPTRAELGWPA